MTSHQLSKFGGHSHCCSGDIMILVCHVISQDHLIEYCCLVKFDGHWYFGSEYIMVLVCNVILQDNVIK